MSITKKFYFKIKLTHFSIQCMPKCFGSKILEQVEHNLQKLNVVT